MKQVLHNFGSGETQVIEVPCPSGVRGALTIANSVSLVSAGTERMLVEFGRSGLISKARQQPDKVREVLQKVASDGLAATLQAVRSKLSQPLALGYSGVGRVIAVGEGVHGFRVGDRVASNGKHAEIVVVPANLCAKVPDDVDDETAAFTVVGAVALQGIRLANPTLGESVAVAGLGLVGLLAVQLLRAQGCRVLGIDPDPHKLTLAQRFGAETVDLSVGEDPVARAERFSRGRGTDAVIIAAATKSSEPVRQAALMSRKRGRIVLVGVTGLELSRADFYEKELNFQVSCSYGPGRYDPEYEEKGHDYPVGLVRWTEQRNFEAVLDTMAAGRLDIKPLISHRFPINEATKAYDIVVGAEPSVGILLEYSSGAPAGKKSRTVRVAAAEVRVAPAAPAVSFIGAGNYATAILMPAFREAGAHFRTAVSLNGLSASHVARKFGFAEATTEAERALSDRATKGIVVATRHGDHARYALAALRSGKHVFVEKPLCLTREELAEVEAVADENPQLLLMVGFNRRFAPQITKIKQLLSAVAGPKSFVMTVNAGAIPLGHWTQAPEVGGGRIVGEGCHFIDLLRFLAGSPIRDHSEIAMSGTTLDTVSIQLAFSDGSIGTIHYFANGSKTFPKERLEIFAAGGILRLDNFRELSGFGWPGFRKMHLWRQDKGQRACVRAFVEAMRTEGPPPIPPAELVEVARVAIESQAALA